VKTIKQIADEVGVSKQSVYKRIKGSLYTDVAPYVHTINGVVYISEQGETIIIKAFSEKNIYKRAHTYAHTKPYAEYIGVHTDNDEITFLREQNKTLLEQLTIKDKQLEEERNHGREQADKLSDLAVQLAELTRNNQLLLGAEQRRLSSALLIDSENEEQQKKGGILQRLFGKKSVN